MREVLAILVGALIMWRLVEVMKRVNRKWGER